MYALATMPPQSIVSYIDSKCIDKSNILSYTINEDKIIIGDNMKYTDYTNDKFKPTKEQINNAKIRLEERKKQGTTNGYNNYIKKLINSYKDVRCGW